MRKRRSNLFLLAAGYWLIATLSGCGYTTRSAVSNQYRTVYIAPFLNKVDITRESDVGSKYRIYRPGLETDVTNAVAKKFLWDGNLKPVKTEDANLVLKGELIEFRKDPLRYDNNENVEEFRINIVVNMSMYDRKNDKMLWQESGFTGEQSYFVSGTQAISEAQAITNAINDLARRIVERTVEQW